eukprot:CAMPEP_0182602682 /NCGR_PEP_ID=MMETSP1324-20130603/92116_1 /TAXON_ID=236786 /ORGANISM="Florenciella sp., Strain RCC1587" /LENGTH=504 /DNA_ID=CAMNT_0024820607 /DNA_START=61 /DNA_END=1576 /DNA_ORIENTATION=-
MAAASTVSPCDPLFLAMSRYRRRKYAASIESCDEILSTNPRDQAVLFLKCRALTAEAYIDDTEMEEEGVGEILLDENATASMPRPGTSLHRPQTSKRGVGLDQSIRPVSSSGRPLTGFARPGTGSRPGTGGQMTVETAVAPATMLGREVRLATASMASDPSGSFLNIERLNFARIAARPPLAMAIAEYLVYHEANPRKALELGAECTTHAEFKDWWWKLTLGKCYYKLGVFREAERQLKSSLAEQDMVVTHLELCKVYLRLDQPNTALEHLTKASQTHPGEPRLVLSIARIHDMLNTPEIAVTYYKRVLALDASNVESVACLAANHFYSDQPEISLRYYRRLLQMGVNNTEMWNNLGLCCFYSSQYDISLSCFERALELADDGNMADVWYNVGQVAVGIGDVSLAYQAFKIATSVDSAHAESFNCIGVLELRKQNVEAAQANFATAQKLAPYLFEPFYNSALLAYKMGNFQDAFLQVSSALGVYPGHSDSLELKRTLSSIFSVL